MNTRLFAVALLLAACQGRVARPGRPYAITPPPGWTSEHMTVPLDFAPEIPYVGTEDAFFPHGWGSSGSHEYWTYAFVWWLDGVATIDTSTLRQNLTDYYHGLVGRNIQRRGIPPGALVPISATVARVQPDPGDSATYAATVHTLDYMGPAPITLYCRISLKANGASGHTAVFFGVSPQPAGDSLWQTLRNMDTSFRVR